jgi:hypothetical protein
MAQKTSQLELMILTLQVTVIIKTIKLEADKTLLIISLKIKEI